MIGKPVQRFTIPCENQKHGKCRFGDQCSFAHTEDRNIKSPLRKQYDENRNDRRTKKENSLQCIFQDTEKGCRYGADKCRFKHRRAAEEKQEETKVEKELNEYVEISDQEEWSSDDDDDNCVGKSFLEKWAEGEHTPQDWQAMWL